jgi:Domain of unknown function (DUF4124)
MRKLVSIAVVALFAASAFAVGGDVYRWKDASGTWHYSDQPQPGAERVRTVKRPPGANTSAPAARSTATAAAPPRSFPVSNEVANQVRQEAASAKADQCKKAEEIYQKTVQARKIYRTDEKGNRTFMNDAELDAARLEARSNRDLACGP